MNRIGDNPQFDKENNTLRCLHQPLWFCGNAGSSPMTKRGLEELVLGPTNMDKLTGQEVHDLSLPERNRVYEEVHGVAEPHQEQPDFVAQRLSELDMQLSIIRNKPAYDFAFRQSPVYVHDRAFRLAFLRSTEFDARKAAQKLVSYFDFKLELFGREKLCKVITYEDLNERDLTILQSGALQILPETDPAGRQMVFRRLDMLMKWLVLDENHAVRKFTVHEVKVNCTLFVHTHRLSLRVLYTFYPPVPSILVYYGHYVRG
jgi:hypothetical protein